MPEADWFELCRQCDLLKVGIVALLCFGWRYVADRLEDATVVEPVDPFEGGELDCIVSGGLRPFFYLAAGCAR